MYRRQGGFSLIELIIVVAIAGILLGIGFVQLNSAGTATSQAARVVASAVNQARFEAIRINANAWLRVSADVDGDGGSVVVCGTAPDPTAVGAFCGIGGRDTSVIRFAGTDLGRARIAQPAAIDIVFDRRGVMRPPAEIEVVVTDRAGGNVRTIQIAATGRAEVQ